MAEEIYQGVDCCVDAFYPTKRPKVYPRRRQVQFDGTLNLSLKNVWPECFESCFTWRLVSGGGWISEEFGIETNYNAPSENDGCKQNPVIIAGCGGYQLEVVRIAVNRYRLDVLAYFDVGDWKEGYIMEDLKPRSRPAPHQTHFGLDPSYGIVTTRLRDCSGGLIKTMHTGIMQAPRVWMMPEHGLQPGRWFGFWIKDKKPYWTGEYGPTYYLAKQQRIREQLGRLPDTTTPKGEDPMELYPWLQLWGDTDYPILGEPFDVRSKRLIDKGCCAFALIPKENGES